MLARTRPSTSPLQKAKDTRRVGFVFLMIGIPMAVVSLIACVVSGDIRALWTTTPSAFVFLAIGVGMYVVGGRDVARLTAEEPQDVVATPATNGHSGSIR